MDNRHHNSFLIFWILYFLQSYSARKQPLHPYFLVNLSCSSNQLPQILRSGISLVKHISSHHSRLLETQVQGNGGANSFGHLDAEIQSSGQAQIGHLKAGCPSSFHFCFIYWLTSHVFMYTNVCVCVKSAYPNIYMHIHMYDFFLQFVLYYL